MTGARPSHSAASLRRRDEIVVATRQLLGERTADKVLVADIAERAGVSVATVYNLVGTRDHVLMSVLDHSAAEVIKTVSSAGEGLAGITRCLSVLGAACEVVCADAVVHRRLLGALGQLAPGLWLDQGLYGSIEQGVVQAIRCGDLSDSVPASIIASTIHLGFRGAIMSWAFGQLSDIEFAIASQRAGLSALLGAANDHVRETLREGLVSPHPVTVDRQ